MAPLQGRGVNQKGRKARVGVRPRAPPPLVFCPNLSQSGLSRIHRADPRAGGSMETKSQDAGEPRTQSGRRLGLKPGGDRCARSRSAGAESELVLPPPLRSFPPSSDRTRPPALGREFCFSQSTDSDVHLVGNTLTDTPGTTSNQVSRHPGAQSRRHRK